MRPDSRGAQPKALLLQQVSAGVAAAVLVLLLGAVTGMVVVDVGVIATAAKGDIIQSRTLTLCTQAPPSDVNGALQQP